MPGDRLASQPASATLIMHKAMVRCCMTDLQNSVDHSKQLTVGHKVCPRRLHSHAGCQFVDHSSGWLHVVHASLQPSQKILGLD